MDRKNRVWLITLIVLLVASIVGLVLVKNQWDASESSYVRANAQLTEEQSSSEKLRARNPRMGQIHTGLFSEI